MAESVVAYERSIQWGMRLSERLQVLEKRYNISLDPTVKLNDDLNVCLLESLELHIYSRSFAQYSIPISYVPTI